MARRAWRQRGLASVPLLKASRLWGCRMRIDWRGSSPSMMRYTRSYRVSNREPQGLRLNSTQSCRLPRNSLIHRHPRGRTTIDFLLGGINAMRVLVHRQAVHSLLDWEILQLTEMVGIVFLKH